MFNYNFPPATENALEEFGTPNPQSTLLFQLDSIEADVRSIRAAIIAGDIASAYDRALLKEQTDETLLRLFDHYYKVDLQRGHKKAIKRNMERGLYSANTTFEDYIEEGR